MWTPSAPSSVAVLYVGIKLGRKARGFPGGEAGRGPMAGSREHFVSGSARDFCADSGAGVLARDAMIVGAESQGVSRRLVIGGCSGLQRL